MNQLISPTRSYSTTKPRVTAADLSFFIDHKEALVFLGVGNNQTAWRSDNLRSTINELPYSAFESIELFKGNLYKIEQSECNDEFDLDYRIVGGFNNNAIEVFWKTPSSNDELVWISLKTFAGVQLKYIFPDCNNSIIFAFAGEDAYCYCDYSPCKECVFRCKHGFVLYAYSKVGKLIKKPCNRLSDEYRSADR